MKWLTSCLQWFSKAFFSWKEKNPWNMNCLLLLFGNLLAKSEKLNIFVRFSTFHNFLWHYRYIQNFWTNFSWFTPSTGKIEKLESNPGLLEAYIRQDPRIIPIIRNVEPFHTIYDNFGSFYPVKIFNVKFYGNMEHSSTMIVSFFESSFHFKADMLFTMVFYE